MAISKYYSAAMKFSKSKVSYIVTAIIAGVIMCSWPYASHASGFMDLELSIKELNQVVQKTSPSLVMVVSYDDSGKESKRGSGFFIDSRGLIITNASVVKDAYSAEAFSKSGNYQQVSILNRDETLDFALIQVQAGHEIPLKLDFDHEIQTGERVVVVGLSPDMKKTVSEGLIVSVEKEPSLMEIQTTKPLLSYSESKDGPLLDMSGKVIGVMSTSVTVKQDGDGIPRMPDYHNFAAVSISTIKEFISRPGQAQHLRPAKSKIWSRWIGRLMKDAAVTVFITLYTIGFSKIIASIFLLVLIISGIQWIVMKSKKNI